MPPLSGPYTIVTGQRSILFTLRDATADRHAPVDTVLSQADLGDRRGYGRFLPAQAAAHIPVEEALDVLGIEAILADWPSRRRGDLIREDLDTLGLPLPPLEDQPRLGGVPALLGAAYVLEGSALGGAVLERSMAAGLPTLYLSTTRPAAWRDLITVIEARLTDPDDLDAAIDAAHSLRNVRAQRTRPQVRAVSARVICLSTRTGER